VKKGIRFEYRPEVKDRSDAIKLLDVLMRAAFIENLDTALEALKDAIEREII
jgi:hypothetical protein